MQYYKKYFLGILFVTLLPRIASAQLQQIWVPEDSSVIPFYKDIQFWIAGLSISVPLLLVGLFLNNRKIQTKKDQAAQGKFLKAIGIIFIIASLLVFPYLIIISSLKRFYL